MGLGDLSIGEPFKNLHGRRRPSSPGDRLGQEKRSALFRRRLNSGAHPGSEQTVAVAQVVIQET